MELFSTPFAPQTWHNFAVIVDWTDRTLAVLYSQNGSHLTKVTGVVANTGAAEGAAGRGDFHFGVLKLPLVDLTDTPAEQADVVHFGIQEGDKEGLIYSGVFVEDSRDGISLGHGEVVAPRDVL
ncbi:hypothetical protein EWM64_g7514 [Hericium alpestre]|uniref:Glycoside hydrolase 131 catalytic N-terminal domain-containing protein n=1 Tax=Hericium alpestre TaxID=135208 RepID=A0A4Y9ZSN8_9AGAM|nr:hypothetical protein EWM64_g7514 [Hericium alpestre]